MKNIKKFLCTLLAVALTFTALPMTVFASNTGASQAEKSIQAETKARAIWDYNITFNANGGKGNNKTQETSFHNAHLCINQLPSANTFTRENHSFKGWAFNKNETSSANIYSAGAHVVFTGNTTMYAIWTDSIDIRFEGNGGSGAPFSEKTSTSGALNMPENQFTRTGYTFVGWSTNKDGSKTNYAPTQQVTFASATTMYAIWLNNETNDNPTTAHYFIRTDGIAPPEPSDYSASAYLPDANVSGKVPGMTGTIKELIAVNNNDGLVKLNLATAPTNDQIRAAVNGRTVNGQNNFSYNPAIHEVVWYVIKASTPWHVDGIIKNKADYTLKYDQNGGEIDQKPGDSTHRPSSTAAVNFARKPTRAGYEFLGWDMNSKATTPTFTEEGTKSFTITQNTTLYAVWEAKQDSSYTIQYLLKGTTTKVQGDTIRTEKVIDQDYTETAPTIKGYNIVGDNTLTVNIKKDGLLYTFYYEKDTAQWGNYVVKYYKDVVGGENLIHTTDPTEVLFDTDVGKDVNLNLNQPANYLTGVIQNKTTVITANNTVIKVLYTKDTAQWGSYVVEYYKDVVDGNNPIHTTAPTEVLFGTDVGKDVNLNLNQPANYLTGVIKNKTTVITANNPVIKVLYTKDTSKTHELSYTVKYYKGDVLQTSDTQIVNKTVWVGDNTLDVSKGDINTTNKYAGYKFSKTDPETIPDTIADEGVIAVYYTKDTAQWGNYVVEYYKDVVDKNPIHTTAPTEVLFDTDVRKDVNLNLKQPANYLTGVIQNKTTVITANNRVIKVLYTKDTAQTHELSYTVKYYKDNVLQASDTQIVNKTVWAGDNTLNVIKSDINTTNKYVGYKVIKTDPGTIPDTIADEGEIKVYYTKDTAQTHELSYTVKYYKDNVLQASDNQIVKKAVWVGDNTLDVSKDGINTTNKYAGYKVSETDPETIPDTIANKGVIAVYYTKDTAQTHELSYTVKYYKDNVLQADDTQIVNKTVWVGDNTLNVIKSDINTTNKYVGYKVIKTDPGTIPDTIADEGEIKVYYTKDTAQTHELSYTVKYYKDNVLQASDTQIVNKTVWAGDNTLNVIKSDINTTNKYVGYKVIKTDPGTIPDTIADQGEIKVYYEEDTNSTLSYTVTYSKTDENGEKFDNFIEAATGTVTVANPKLSSEAFNAVAKVEEKTPKGYVYNAADSKLPTNNVKIEGNERFHINYVIKAQTNRTYTVNYFIENEPQESLTYTGTAYEANDYKISGLKGATSGGAYNILIGNKLVTAIDETLLTVDSNGKVINLYYVQALNEIPVVHEYKLNNSTLEHSTNEVITTIPANGEILNFEALKKLTPNANTYAYTGATVSGKLKSALGENANATLEERIKALEAKIAKTKAILESADNAVILDQYKALEEELAALQQTPTGDSNTNDAPQQPTTGDSNTNDAPQQTPAGDSNTNDVPQQTPAGDSNTNDAPQQTPAGDSNTNDVPQQTPAGDSNTNDATQQTPAGDSNTNDVPQQTPAGDGNTDDAPPTGDGTATPSERTEEVIKAEMAAIEKSHSVLIAAYKALPTLEAELLALEEALEAMPPAPSNQQIGLTETIAPEKPAETFTQVLGASETTFNYDSRYDYVITINYNRTVSTPPQPPQPPYNPSNPSNPTTNEEVIIEDAETPLGKLPDDVVEIIDEKTPLGKLPKSGGLQSTGLVGLGLLAFALATGLKLKKKED